ncbi:MAG: hypothetical protein CSA22_06790 [Deltaproteobacteria bacterium]|nr:MAG: hypothetical protein CSA22_06790 [Deltaproteobacteria bacterium]
MITCINRTFQNQGISPLAATNWLEDVNIRPGFTLNLLHFTLNTQVEIQYRLDKTLLVFGCFLTGQADSIVQHRHQAEVRTRRNAGYYGVSFLSGLQGSSHFPAGVPVSAVHIAIKPEMVATLGPEICQELPQVLKKSIAGKQDGTFCRTGTMTPAMQQVVNQLLDFPCHKPSRRIYLEGKSVELISLMMEYCVIASDKKAASSFLTPADITRIQQAHDYILEKFRNPPSLLALARHVGLNDCKLKQGFRHLYGNSVFGCLHEYRMNQARAMLRTGTMSIKEIAYAVGYKNAHSFSDAFNKYFGIRPSRYY